MILYGRVHRVGVKQHTAEGGAFQFIVMGRGFIPDFCHFPLFSLGKPD